jgi:hypothetical protein
MKNGPVAVTGVGEFGRGKKNNMTIVIADVSNVVSGQISEASGTELQTLTLTCTTR